MLRHTSPCKPQAMRCKADCYLLQPGLLLCSCSHCQLGIFVLLQAPGLHLLLCLQLLPPAGSTAQPDATSPHAHRLAARHAACADGTIMLGSSQAVADSAGTAIEGSACISCCVCVHIRSST